MKGLQRVVWSEGMLVSPQHLQQADLYHERMLDCRLAASTPLSWGISAVQVDAGALAADQLVVSRFSGVFPDGLPLDFKAGDPEAPRRAPSARNSPPRCPHWRSSWPCPRSVKACPRWRRRLRRTPKRRRGRPPFEPVSAAPARKSST